MATRFIERIAGGAAALVGLSGDSTGNVFPIVFDADDDKLKYYDRTLSVVRVVDDGRLPIYTPTGAVTLTAAQSGYNVMLNNATGFAITLPLPASGLRYRFTVAAAFATSSFTVGTNGGANIIFGGAKVLNSDVPAADEDLISFVNTAETKGDYVDVWSDGTNWYVDGRAAATGGITFTVT